MKVISPPDTEKWRVAEVSFCHAKLDKVTNDIELEYNDKIGPNCVGLATVSVNPDDEKIICRDFDFFNEGAVLKIWGFAEDFSKQAGSIAILHEGRWYLKEESDDFEYGGHFNKDGEIESFYVSFSDSHKEIRTTVTDGG